MGRKSFAWRTMGLAAVAAMAGALLLGDVNDAFADGFGPGQKQRPKAPVVNPAAAQQLGQTGEISLANGKIKLSVPAAYYFASAAEARTYLQRINAPVPAGEVLGMVAPAGVRSIDDNFWGAVISINPMGHVAEERAARLSDDDFINEVRSARPAGAPALETFAAKPAYDGSRRATTWAERYAASGPGTRPYRNETRLLGRASVVGVTLDAKSGQIAQVQGAAPTITRMISFQPGQTYGDYNAASDGASVYDLPSLLTNKPKPQTPAAAPAAEPAPPPAPTPAPAPEPAPATTTAIGGAQGIPAQSSGLQRLDTATSEPAGAKVAAPSAELAKWMPWIAGGLVLLAVIPWVVGMLNGAGRLQDTGRPLRRRVVINDPNLDPPADETPPPPSSQT